MQKRAENKGECADSDLFAAEEKEDAEKFMAVRV